MLFSNAAALFLIVGEPQNKDLQSFLTEALRVGKDVCLCRDVQPSAIQAPQAVEILNRLAVGAPRELVRAHLAGDQLQAISALYTNSGFVQDLEAIALGDVVGRVGSIEGVLNTVLTAGKFDVESESAELWTNAKTLKVRVDEQVLSSIAATGRSCGKQALVDQVGITSHLLDIIDPLADLVVSVLLAKTKEEKSINPEKVKAMSALRRSVSGMAAFLRGGLDLNATFTQSAGGLWAAWDPEFVGDIFKFANELCGEVCKMWAQDLVALTSLVNSWSPEGWQSKKEELLEHEAVLNSLLRNPQFKTLSAANSKLEAMRKHIKTINLDGFGAVCEPQALKDAGCANQVRESSAKLVGESVPSVNQVAVA